MGGGRRARPGQCPATLDPKKPTRLVIFATPNGNTIEQTLGCAQADGLDWHFDIQHVAAQVRKLREVPPEENVVLACVEAEGLSWPAWKRKHARRPGAHPHGRRDDPRLAAGEVACGSRSPATAAAAASCSASSTAATRSPTESIASSSSTPTTLLRRRQARRQAARVAEGRATARLVVIAYDDREITLNGKRVVGPDGGTFRATSGCARGSRRTSPSPNRRAGDIVTRTALDGRLALLVHANPKNRILHTALVGEMNGLLRGPT